MKNNIIPYHDPALCVHFAAKNRCAAGWFHGRCSLSFGCIRCPKYESKTGLTYDIENEDVIINTYGGDYFLEHVIASLKFAFAQTPGFILTHYADIESDTLCINDVADKNCMLEFQIVEHCPNKLYLNFTGRIKG